MKWTDDKDNELKKLISEGKGYEELSVILGRTIKSLQCRANRLKLKLVYYLPTPCKNCGKDFQKRIKSNQIFCGSSCSGSYNTKGRKHSEETKFKISNSLKKEEIYIIKKDMV